MTLVVYTESHGEVESGFFAFFTQFTRLGDYTFVTKQFCEISRQFAENPRAKHGRILAYNTEKFWRRFEEGFDDAMQNIDDCVRKFKCFKPEIVTQSIVTNGNSSLEDELDLGNEGEIVPIYISDDEKTVTIGKYNMLANQFGFMAYYAAHGGWLGWSPGHEPDYAQPTLQALNSSERLYFNGKKA